MTDAIIPEIVAEIPEAPPRYLEITVTDDPSYIEACNALVQIKSIRKQIASRYDPAIKAANDTHKKAIALKKTAEEHIVPFEKHLKEECVKWEDAIEKKNKEAQALLSPDGQGIMFIPVVVETPVHDGVSSKKNWTFRVTDFHALLIGIISGVVPEEAVVTNDSFIRKEILKKTTTLGYPGIEPYQERIMSVSTKG